jgi:hypothetical protein
MIVIPTPDKTRPLVEVARDKAPLYQKLASIS